MIYIPIWCYFYLPKEIKAIDEDEFTFQYGATSTIISKASCPVLSVFTFQYGATST